ncbi:hypothetical protein BRADI_5g07831v3 [Brachypodium distachyon]|uniref:Uncharacterized protein n=1 Tax=Brachypodium distachyon TaxID=15368 RepID=A0A2K2CFU9_BRADI|nr:hypothetical protein BRADI_5g07831v3 [Brachypodium distachyon]PNT60908.1 hypothetical protein BRADI_5g07831v3 [Brachypodium distachyon]
MASLAAGLQTKISVHDEDMVGHCTSSISLCYGVTDTSSDLIRLMVIYGDRPFTSHRPSCGGETGTEAQMAIGGLAQAAGEVEAYMIPDGVGPRARTDRHTETVAEIPRRDPPEHPMSVAISFFFTGVPAFY